MATRSLIGYTTADNTVRATYCHFDGYPSGVGATLLEHYHTPEAVETLIQYEMSALDADGTPEYIENGEEGARVWRGPVSFLNDFDLYGTEYHYLLTPEGWLVNGRHDERFYGTAFKFLEEVVTASASNYHDERSSW